MTHQRAGEGLGNRRLAKTASEHLKRAEVKAFRPRSPHPYVARPDLSEALQIPRRLLLGPVALDARRGRLRALGRVRPRDRRGRGGPRDLRPGDLEKHGERVLEYKALYGGVSHFLTPSRLQKTLLNFRSSQDFCRAPRLQVQGCGALRTGDARVQRTVCS